MYRILKENGRFILQSRSLFWFWECFELDRRVDGTRKVKSYSTFTEAFRSLKNRLFAELHKDRMSTVVWQGSKYDCLNNENIFIDRLNGDV